MKTAVTTWNFVGVVKERQACRRGTEFVISPGRTRRKYLTSCNDTRAVLLVNLFRRSDKKNSSFHPRSEDGAAIATIGARRLGRWQENGRSGIGEVGNDGDNTLFGVRSDQQMMKRKRKADHVHRG